MSNSTLIGVSNILLTTGQQPVVVRPLLTIEPLPDGTIRATTKLNSSDIFNNAFVNAGGSSTMNGQGATAPNRLKDLIEAELSARSSGSSMFFESATNGWTTNDFRPEYTNDPDIQPHRNITALSSMGADIVLVWFTTNDQANGANTSAEYISYLQEIIAEGNRKGAYVFICSPTPRTAYDQTARDRLIESLGLARSTFDPSILVDIFDELAINGITGDPDGASIKPIYRDPDLVHFNAAGHSYMNTELFVTLDNFFVTIPSYEAIEIERSTSPTTGFTVLENSASLIQTLTREDTQEYYYRCRVRISSGVYSEYSNVVSLEQLITAGAADQVIKVNFAPAAGTPVATYNNWLSDTPTAGLTLSSVLDETGGSTAVTMEILNGFSATGTNGQTGGLFPDDALSTYWQVDGNSDDPARIRISGLSPTNTYSVELISSRVYGQQDRWTGVTVGRSYQSVNSANNTGSDIARVNNVIPNASGQIEVDLKAPWLGIGYVNILRITRYDYKHVS